MLHENTIARHVVDAALQVHQQLGPGLLESVYRIVLAHELRRRGLVVEREVPVPIRYNGVIFEEGFRADLVVAEKVLVELKSVESLAPVHAKQVLTYLRLTNRKLGLLINFGESQIKNGIKWLINGTLDAEEDASN
jgi:GxxExxY protein